MDVCACPPVTGYPRFSYVNGMNRVARLPAHDVAGILSFTAYQTNQALGLKRHDGA